MDKSLIDTIEIKIKLKEPIDGKEYIHYTPFKEDLDPILFKDIIDAVDGSMFRSIKDINV